MKDCSKIHPLLSLYSEGELSPRDKSRVAGHLKQCSEARQELKALEAMGLALKNMPEPAFPSDLHDKIMSRVKGGKVSSPAPKRSVIYTLLPLAAAAGLACFFLFQYPVGLKQWHATSPSQSQNEMAVDKEVAPAQEAKDLDLKSAAPSAAPMRLAKAFPSAPPPASAPAAKSEGASADYALESNQLVAAAHSKKKMELYRDETAQKPSEAQPAAAGAPAANLAQSQPAASGNAASSDSAQLQEPKNLTLAYSAARVAQPAPTTEPADTFSGGFTSTPTDELEELITDNDTLQKMWQNLPINKSQPTVDFTKQAVIVLLAGQKPTTGYTIAVTRLEETETQLVVHYKVGVPSAGGPVGEMVTHPWFLQVISKPSKPIFFAQD